MKFVDEVIVIVVAGRGGDGCLSFHRGPNLPRGGPDGGNGGRGGDVVLVGDDGLGTLVDLRYQNLLKAKNGKGGSGNNRTGKNGEDLIVPVPCGTTVIDDDAVFVLGDITNAEQRMVVAHGGGFGRGNASFRSSIHRSPRVTTKGGPGETRRIRLQLRVLADVGLFGLPNAGKSTLISRVSASKPKVAEYPFTTLVPNLGVVYVGPGQSFVMADIPGLIQGAAEGHGLGIQFLRHLSRTSLLLHLVDAAPIDGSNPLGNHREIEAELFRYSDAFRNRVIWTVLTKIDLLPQEQVDSLVEQFKSEYSERRIFAISAVADRKIGELTQFVGLAIAKNNQEDTVTHDQAIEEQLARDVLRNSLSEESENDESDDDGDTEVISRRG